MYNPKSLHDAVEYGKLEDIESLLKSGTDPNIVDASGMTPVHLVCYRPSLSDEQFQIMKLLIRYKADLNVKDNFGNSPMVKLFDPDHDYKTLRLDMLKLLLENGAEVPQNYKTRSQQSPHNHQNSELIKQIDMLLERGSGLSFYEFPYESPLHLAVHFKALEIVELLLKIGVNPNEPCDQGLTPLNRICSLPKLTDVDLKMIRLLLQYKADVNKKNHYFGEEEEEEYEMDYWDSDENSDFAIGNTPMINLFYNKEDYGLRKEVLKLLLDRNAKFTESGRGGFTILDVLLQKELNTNVIEIIELLIQYGIDLNMVNKNGTTPLYNPIFELEPEKVEVLLKKGANPNICCFDSATPLNFICRSSKLTSTDVDLIKLLIQYKADVNIQDNYGCSPIENLHHALQNRMKSSCRYDFHHKSEDNLYRKQIFEILKKNNADLTGLDSMENNNFT